jgi:tRNA(adenine34) deaminase
MRDERWMREALGEALKGPSEDDVPIGAVVVRDGVVVGRGRNEIERRSLATAHAEILAIEDAARTLADWRLDGCTVYVTVEPCHMCMGAFYLSRVARVVYGAPQPRTGACGSVDRFHEAALMNHAIEVRGGVLEDEARRLLREFFSHVRSRGKGRRDARAG